MMFRSILLVVTIGCIQAVAAQSVSGSWYGKADVIMPGNTSNYLTELALKQKGGDVEGIFGYYFKDSYQSFFVRGTFDKKTRQLNIKNLPVLFYASPSRTGIECPMHFEGTLMVSRVSSTIKGSFYTDTKYKYTCPELRVNLVMDSSENNQQTLARGIVGRKFWAPQQEDFVVSGYAVRKRDTTPAAYAAVATLLASAMTGETSDALAEEFGKRNNIYEKDIVVYDDSILVSFYDNGDIDDDTISVFLNKKPVLAKRGITSRALNIYIGLDSVVEVNELSMFADNLGKFPPNTALMVITDGSRRYELYLSASLKQNASVRLRRPRR